MENTQNANVKGKKLPYEKPEVEVIERYIQQIN